MSLSLVYSLFSFVQVEDLMTGQAGIIRHRSKIVGSVRNAQLFLDIQQNHGSFANYLWDFVGGKPIMRRPASMEDVPVRSEEGDALSRDLKARGFKFTGPVIMYSYMQAVKSKQSQRLTHNTRYHITMSESFSSIIHRSDW